MKQEDQIFPSCYNCSHYMNPGCDECDLHLPAKMKDTVINCIFFDPA